MGQMPNIRASPKYVRHGVTWANAKKSWTRASIDT